MLINAGAQISHDTHKPYFGTLVPQRSLGNALFLKPEVVGPCG